ncbi:unnamed protein product [Trichobilharzia szidati]|nr:unnamed protein product [Trichobilharzia szidati]
MPESQKPSSRWNAIQLSIIFGCLLVISALLYVIIHLLTQPSEVTFNSHLTQHSVNSDTETILKEIASNEETIITNASTTTDEIASLPVTPCNDFYRYACDKWEKDNPIPEDKHKINTFSSLNKKIEKYIWRLFANSSYATNDIHLNNVRKFYKSCVERGNISLEDLRSQVRQIIAKTYGEWELLPSTHQTVTVSSDVVKDSGKQLSLLDLYLPLLSTSGGSPLFSLDIHGKFPPTIHISIAEYSFGAESYKTEEESLLMAPSYYEFAHTLGVPESEANKLIDAFELSFRLAHNSYFANKRPSSKGKQTVGMDELKAICPPMDWENLFAKLFKETDYKDDYRLLPIIVEDAMALKHQCVLHEIEMSTSSGRSALHNMAVMELLLPLMDFIFSKQDKLVPMDSKVDSGLNPKYSEFCIERLTEIFPWTIEKHYIAQRIKDNHRNEVVNMVKEIKEALYSSIEEVTWLNKRTKKFAIDKISNITVFASSYDFNMSQFKENLSLIYKYPIDEDTYIVNEHFARKSKYLDNSRGFLLGIPDQLEHFIASHRAKAYYFPNHNRIHIHAALLNPPYFSDGKEDSVKYGGLGWVIAHELLHAVDTTEWRCFDAR